MVLFVPLLVLLALFFGVINRDYLDHSFLMSDTFQLDGIFIRHACSCFHPHHSPNRSVTIKNIYAAMVWININKQAYA